MPSTAQKKSLLDSERWASLMSRRDQLQNLLADLRAVRQWQAVC
jgi:hypothetical protein